MAFRLVYRLSGDESPQSHESGERLTAMEAFALYRQLTRVRPQAVEILDLRTSSALVISSAELEAIAQSERHVRFKAALSVALRSGDAPCPSA